MQEAAVHGDSPTARRNMFPSALMQMRYIIGENY